MRVIPPPMISSCRTCGRSFTKSWFRLNQKSEFCSGICRRMGLEISSIGKRIDKLMELYRTTGPECIRDLYLTMADSECARMKILTRWDSL